MEMHCSTLKYAAGPVEWELDQICIGGQLLHLWKQLIKRLRSQNAFLSPDDSHLTSSPSASMDMEDGQS